MEKKTLQACFILIMGISISAIMVLAFPKLYHLWDVPEFFRWSKIWDDGWNAIYVNCVECNYPIVGMFSTAGLIRFLRLADTPDPALSFRLILSVVDGLNVLLIYLLLKELSVKDAAVKAGVIGLLVSSWAGGALWGQIDNVSQFFLLLTLLWMVKYHRSMRINFFLFLGITSVLMAFMVLTKQLIVFSFFSLELLLLATIFLRRKWFHAIGYSLFHFAVFLVFVFGWDLFLDPVNGYRSHLQLIWGERSTHGEILSANGLNLWNLLPREMNSSSASPFPLFTGTAFEKIITPVNIGLFLFLVLAALISVSTLLKTRKPNTADNRLLNREALLNFILHLAVINLIFNVVLTGTHERYLYHFYPFILIAFVGLAELDERWSNFPLPVLMLGSTLYGAFVLGVLWGMFAFRNYPVHMALAVFHAALLGALIVVSLKYQGFAANLRDLAGRLKRPRPFLQRE
ncbi:MAG: hypothetical protein WBM17_09810 [Anaerolineales bacterium]